MRIVLFYSNTSISSDAKQVNLYFLLNFLRLFFLHSFTVTPLMYVPYIFNVITFLLMRIRKRGWSRDTEHHILLRIIHLLIAIV